jgi:uncharacterized protein YlxW (UPF0749 family)
MKKIMIAVALLVCFAASPAVADETTAVLDQTIAELREQVETLRERGAGLEDKVERKNELLACERGNRRELVRALQEGDRVVTLARCN